MNVIAEHALDGYGNKFQAGYDILKQENNSTQYRRYVVLHVVPGGSVTFGSSSRRASFWNPNITNALNYSYGGGDHVLVQQDVTVQHDSQGQHTETIAGNVYGGFVDWNFSVNVDFPRTAKIAPISSFTGDTITGNFKATYTPDSGYTYKLRISIPNVYMLQKYDNYVSGTDVTLNDASIAYIRNYTNKSTVEIGGVIETYKNGTYVGESEELKIYPRTTSGVRLRVNGAWKEAVPYVRVNGVWKEAVPYVRVNNQWKEGI